ncbi:hypothetical protein SAY86_031317 [Trapa natans]|uniref:IQ domain-containing protein IQM2-like n=1 Tax=Trapa natans TaxID=22666 RepID=A0AAN7LTU5_TRANT|nr:hypothetical protein SAY86_031317 [Trapa natans]
MIVKSLGDGQLIVERSISFKRSELGALISVSPPSLDEKQQAAVVSDGSISEETNIESPMSRTSALIIQELLPHDPSSPKHEAATKLQKVYKSFRTRRKLADCVVLLAQNWWGVLDSVELRRSSVSFFDSEKHETAISRWSRAGARAAKVGKGLSKNDKAQKLALQHWLEAIDPRHIYGHNLHFYFVNWMDCQSKEHFFYWLDIGEGKEVNLEKCPRPKLQQRCIRYLDLMERKVYEVGVLDGKFFYKQSGEILHTVRESKDAKWIFVLSTSKTLYVGQKKKGTFQHSRFLAGGATSAAGWLVVEDGILKAIWPHSGHYRPTQENFKDFLSFLEENSIDISNVKMNSMDDKDDLPIRQNSSTHTSYSTGEDCTRKGNDSTMRQQKSDEEETASASLESNISRMRLDISSENGDEIRSLTNENALHDAEPEPPVAQKAIASQKSIQPGKQMSCRWMTGAGDRTSGELVPKKLGESKVVFPYSDFRQAEPMKTEKGQMGSSASPDGRK